tara:strand:- start:1396 stop:2166 length:771 start_codon:yes stop_codon:yes gene_type:complete
MLKIEFSAHEHYVSLKEDTPKPIKINIPEWFKKLEHGKKDKNFSYQKTIKGCIPFLETLTSGYLLKTVVDYKLEHGIHKDKEGNPTTKFYNAIEDSGWGSAVDMMGGSLNPNGGAHGANQVKGSPFIKTNGNLPFNKIINPWTIKTPKGYSCLFLNPLNNTQQDYFSIIPGIVHTDKYDQEVNFPIIINHEKYGNLDLMISKGTPYVQVIPFKRDDWQMTIKSKSTKDKLKNLFWPLLFLNNYKNRIFNKDKTTWI